MVVVTQSCLALCDPTDYSPPDSSVLEILQGRILEGIAIFFSRSLSDPGMESLSLALQADFLLSHREAKLTGCHRFLFQFVVHPGMGTGLPYISVCVSYSVISDSLQPLGLYSLPGSSVHRILQARILEWVAISFSRVSSQPRIEPGSHAFQADALPSELLFITCPLHTNCWASSDPSPLNSICVPPENSARPPNSLLCRRALAPEGSPRNSEVFAFS